LFKIGDLIICGNTGVCTVTNIAVLDLVATEKKSYYVLSPLYQNGVIYIATDNKKVFMRPIISIAEVEKLIDTIHSTQAEAYYCNALSGLIKHYDFAIKSHECKHLIELTMSIYAKKEYVAKQNRKLGTIDEKYLKRAEELLFGEMAAALNITKDEVPDYISVKLER
jgi:CarD family transcriptional regulator